MSDEGRLFLEACGASGPLRFEWTDPTTAEVRRRDIEQPALVVGRDPAADLVLDDFSVEPYHAFLLVVEGRLFAIDLGSTGGLRWGEIPRAAGWVNRGQPLSIGRFTIRLVGGDREDERTIVQPAPTSSRYVSRLNPPEVYLQFQVATAGNEGRFQRDVLDRVLVLAGSSERCKLRVQGRSVPEFICALIRTVEGLWMANIFATEGARVNGAFCRFARLEDEDVLQLANSHVRVSYNDTAQTPIVRASNDQATASPGPARNPRPVDRMAIPVDGSSPEILLQPLLEMAGSEIEPESSPFGQALVLLVRLLGDVHRDHLALVRDELAEIRRLSQDMAKLRGTTRQPEPRQPLGLDWIGSRKELRGTTRQPEPRQPPLSHSNAPNGTTPMADDSSLPEGATRPHPQAVPDLIGERLEAWERERQSRWRKILNLLVRS